VVGAFILSSSSTIICLIVLWWFLDPESLIQSDEWIPKPGSSEEPMSP
jgi:hypothetical protein